MTESQIDKLSIPFCLLILCLPYRDFQLGISISIALCFFVFFVHLVRARPPISCFKTPFNVQLIIFIALCILSIFTTKYHLYVAENVFHDILFKIGIFFIVASIPFKERHLRIILIFYLASLILTCSFIFWEAIKSGLHSHYGGFSGGPSEAALWISMGLPYLLVFFPPRHDKRVSAILILISILFLSAVIITQNRSSLLSLGVASILFLFISAIKRKRYAVNLLAIVLIVLSAFWGFHKNFNNWRIFTHYSEIITNFCNLNSDELYDKYKRIDPSTGIRLGKWKLTLEEIRQSPLKPKGYGRTFWMNMREKYGADKPYAGRYVHNKYLGIAYYLGFLGLAVYLWLLLKILISFYPKNFSFSSIYHRIIIATFYMTIIVLIDGFFWEHEGKELEMAFWLLLGIGLKGKSLLQKQLSGIKKFKRHPT